MWNKGKVMQTSIVIHIAGPKATALVFTPAAGPFQAPVPKGTVFGKIAVTPAAWTGNLTVSGAAAATIGLNAAMEVVALADIPAGGDYAITVSAVE